MAVTIPAKVIKGAGDTLVFQCGPLAPLHGKVVKTTFLETVTKRPKRGKGAGDVIGSTLHVVFTDGSAAKIIAIGSVSLEYVL